MQLRHLTDSNLVPSNEFAESKDRIWRRVEQRWEQPAVDNSLNFVAIVFDA